MQLIVTEQDQVRLRAAGEAGAHAAAAAPDAEAAGQPELGILGDGA